MALSSSDDCYCFEQTGAQWLFEVINFPVFSASPASLEHLMSSPPSQERVFETGTLGCFLAPEDSPQRSKPASEGQIEADSVVNLSSPGRNE